MFTDLTDWGPRLEALARVDEYLKLGQGGAFPTAPFEEVSRAQAPCKEVVLTGDAIDITKFAFIQSNPADSAISSWPRPA